MAKRNLLIVNNHYYPGHKAGGPIVSISNLIKILSPYFRVVVLTKNFDYGDPQPYQNLEADTLCDFENYEVYYASSYSSLLKLSNYFHPDIIYANSFFSPFCLSYIAICSWQFKNIKYIISPRGEMGEGALRIKPLRKSIFLKIHPLFYKKTFLFHATSVSEHKDIQRELAIDAKIIPNIPRILKATNYQLSKRNAQLHLVYVSRITEKKNLLYALKVLASLEHEGDIKFDLWGPIEEKLYWQLCKEVIKTIPSNTQVSYKGAALPDAIPALLGQYHALFLPTSNENFGHAIIEAMQCGAVPVISDQTPWRHLYKNKAGWDIPLKAPEEFSQVIKNLLHLSQQQYQQLSLSTSQYASKILDLATAEQHYLELFGVYTQSD